MTHQQSVQPFQLPNAIMAPHEDSDPRDPDGAGTFRIVSILWKSRLWLAASMLFGLGLGIAALHNFPPSYKSAVSILLDPKQAGSFGPNEEFASVAVDSGKVADVEQILISSKLLQEVVTANNLADDPQFNGIEVSPLQHVVQALTGRTETPSRSPAMRMERAIDRLGRMIRTARVGLTYVITVTVTAPSGKQAQHLAAAVADTYIADQVAMKYAAAHDDAAWLKARLAEIRPELVASEAHVMDIRHQYGLFQTGSAPGSTMNRQRLTELTSELAKAQAEEADAGAQYQEATRTLKTGGSPDVGSSLLLDGLRASAAEAERKLADISAVYGPRHPARIEAALSLATLDGRMRVEARRLTERLGERYRAAQARVASVQALLGAIVREEAATDNVHGRALLNEAERIAQVNLTTYEAALNRLHDVEQQETRQKAEAGIISPAPFPEHPSFPRPMICLPLGAAFGLLLGAGLTLLRAILFKSLDDPELAESQLRLPVLGVIPLLGRRDLGWRRDPSCVLAFLQDNATSAFADGVRRLRLSLRSCIGTETAVVQFTSPAPNAGKSTLAASLAMSAAMSGVKTSLVDFDLHRPSVRPMFKGLLAPEVIGHGGLVANMSRHPHLPLAVMTLGAVGKGTTAFLEEGALPGLIAELRTMFDLVIIDSPPVLASSDAVLAAQFVDATVLVCAVQSTSCSEALRASRALRLGGAHVCGLVLNKAKISVPTYEYGPARRPRRLAHSVAGPA